MLTAALLLAVAATATSSLDEEGARARLAEVQRGFATRPRAESEAALEALAATAPSTRAGGEALLWLGNLAQQAGARTRAAELYTRVLPAGGELAALATRGLGDVALDDGRFAEAERAYAAAARGARAVPLVAELTQKRTLAHTLFNRHRLAWAASALLAACVALCLWLGRGRGWRVPLEVWVALPLQILLVAAGLGRDPQTLRALGWIAGGSLVLVWLWGRLPSGMSGRRTLALTLTACAGNLSLVYLVLERLRLIDALMTTLGLTPPL